MLNKYLASQLSSVPQPESSSFPSTRDYDGRPKTALTSRLVSQLQLQRPGIKTDLVNGSSCIFFRAREALGFLPTSNNIFPPIIAVEIQPKSSSYSYDFQYSASPFRTKNPTARFLLDPRNYSCTSPKSGTYRTLSISAEARALLPAPKSKVQNDFSTADLGLYRFVLAA
ncbi:hypothetical protein VTL71DRAFT_10997 [Oculimacula yallundae]|uniref:Uncharacterized protein n=1 Tax=Oculimacula yallundae TaxID=86028 RepID=A0ABR4CW53_9HELO